MLKCALVIVTTSLFCAAIPAQADSWQMFGRDREHTGRSDFVVPAERLNHTFFDVLAWQMPSPDSQFDGFFGSSSMPYWDSAGPNGGDIVLGAYHWPKGIQGMDRHTGSRFWFGNPGGGESIAERTPAFSNDGASIYVTNDATDSEEWTKGHPLMAFSPAVGPAIIRHNGGDPVPQHLEMDSPVVAPDGRVFAHDWVGRPHAGTDTGVAIEESWAADSEANCGHSDPALHLDGTRLRVVIGNRDGVVHCFDGQSGTTLWTAAVPGNWIDSTPTIDPENGNVYVPATGNDGSMFVVGLTSAGAALWQNTATPVFQWSAGDSLREWVRGAGCLSHDGSTYYFQSLSTGGTGKLYAVNTVDGSLRWAAHTRSMDAESSDIPSASPIVTPNGVVIIGNNRGNPPTYFAVLDQGDTAEVLDSLNVAADANARAHATLSADGRLYLPVRMPWLKGNGNGDVPDGLTRNLFTSFDLSASALVAVPPAVETAGSPGLLVSTPNPVSGSCRIRFELRRAQPVRLDVINASGEVVGRITDRHFPAGTHELEWRGLDGAGRRLAAGVYALRLSSGWGAKQIKITLLAR